MTKLKRLWRDSLSEPERDYWRAQFESTRSQSALRQEIQEKYNVKLLQDSQLNRFRDWMDEFTAIEKEKQKVAEDLAELQSQGLTGAKLRDELLTRIKARALARGDYKLGLKAIAADVKVETLQLGWEKFKSGARTKLETGLDAVAEAFKANPQAMESYQKACELVGGKT